METLVLNNEKLNFNAKGILTEIFTRKGKEEIRNWMYIFNRTNRTASYHNIHNPDKIISGIYGRRNNGHRILIPSKEVQPNQYNMKQDWR